MVSVAMRVYQSQQIREIEQLANERLNLSSSLLMQRAGKAAYHFLIQHWPEIKKIAVFCGSGNNGGDGLVLAQFCYQRGLSVSVYLVGKIENLKEEAKEAYHACLSAGVSISEFNNDIDLREMNLVVDAICGIGLKQELRDLPLQAVEMIKQAKHPIFSLDIPTGINADTGSVMGNALSANATMTFIGLKPGLLTGQGLASAGHLTVSNLELPDDIYSSISIYAEKTNLHSYVSYLKPRSRDWHKGLSGHVLIIGGYVGFSGAPRMAAMAALRVGAGLVSIATHPDHAAMMNAQCPELMCHGINDPDDLKPLLAKANVIVAGPGLSQMPWSKMLWEVICNQTMPLIIDADALNLLSETTKSGQKSHDHWILTPHPGEAARLLHDSALSIQTNRVEAAKRIQKQYGGVCVLKGAGSIIFSNKTRPAICDCGNPGMSSAGTGDILSGVIGGLVAQGLPNTEAAKLGVHLHAMAGDCASQEGERGMIATDLLPFLRQLVNCHFN
jgi:hydroxyethylthiazole kinase-like uncharacterized protein yjeF